MILNSANLTTFFQGAQTIFNKAFTGFKPLWPQVATLVPSTTSQEDYGWLGSWPRMREWLGDREVMNLAAYDYTIKNKKFESTVAVSRDDLGDDKFGVYNPMFQAMAEAGAEHPDELTFGLLNQGITTQCYDGQYFFDIDHPVSGVSVSNVDNTGAGNYWYVLDARKALKPLIFQRRRDYSLRSMVDLNDEHVFMTDEFLFGVDARVNVGFGFWQMAYASNQTLSGANFGATEAAMLAFKDDNGRPLNVSPSIVVVGPSNVAAARQTFLVDRLANGASNPYFNTVKILTVPWLA
jgi:phage major head subunit gpT-like protein